MPLPACNFRTIGVCSTRGPDMFGLSTISTDLDCSCVDGLTAGRSGTVG